MTARRREDLHARRNATFSHEFTFAHADGTPVDFTGAALALEVRLHGAAPGDALIRLVGVDAPARHGLFASPGSVQAWIDEVDVRLLPAGRAERSAVFDWDLVVTLPGVVPRIWRKGGFIVAAGVTDRLTLRTTETGDGRVTEAGAWRATE